MQVVWEGNWISPNGHATVTRNMVRALTRQGVTVKLHTTENYDMHEYGMFLDGDLWGMVSRRDAAMDETIRIIHRAPPDFQRGNERLTIGMTYLEATDIPKSWVTRINSEVDALVLPSQQAAEIARRAGVIRPIWVVPQGVDTELFRPRYPGEPDAFELPPFRFLSVFEWVPRKGYDALLRAYWREFRATDNVCLVIKTRYFGKSGTSAWTALQRQYRRYRAQQLSHQVRGKSNRTSRRRTNKRRPHRVQAVRQSIQTAGTFGRRFAPYNQAPIFLFEGTLSDNELAQLYRHCSAFVLPTRGEGIGLPLLEAAATGLPLIVTGWGGQMDFIRAEDAYVVNYRLQSIPRRLQRRWASLQGSWAEPNIISLRRQMRHVYETTSHMVSPKAVRQQQHVVTNWNWDACARHLIRHLEGAVGGRL